MPRIIIAIMAAICLGATIYAVFDPETAREGAFGLGILTMFLSAFALSNGEEEE